VGCTGARRAAAQRLLRAGADALLRGIVVEGESLGPTEAATLARERPLPEELAAVP
jgi:hypothetical protein